MARRKNTRRFDPRYFMNEKLEEQAVIGADYEDTSDEPTVSTDATGEQWKRISAGDPALAKKVAELAWDQGIGLQNVDYKIELGKKNTTTGLGTARDTIGKLLGQQTGIKTDDLGRVDSKDHFYLADMVWEDFIQGPVVKQLYYLHHSDGPRLPYKMDNWLSELPNPKPMPSKNAGADPNDPATLRVSNRPRTRFENWKKYLDEAGEYKPGRAVSDIEKSMAPDLDREIEFDETMDMQRVTDQLMSDLDDVGMDWLFDDEKMYSELDYLRRDATSPGDYQEKIKDWLNSQDPAKIGYKNLGDDVL